MKLKIWGCRGSFPKPHTTETLRDKEAQLLYEIAQNPEWMSSLTGLLVSKPSEEDFKSFLNHINSLATKVYGGNTSCYSLEMKNKSGEDELVILDGGSGMTELGNYLLKEKIMKGQKVKSKIFFSHVHGDHIEGYPFFIPAYVPGNEFVLMGMPNVVDTLAEEADRNSARVGTETRIRKEEELTVVLRKLKELEGKVIEMAAKDGVKPKGVKDEKTYNSGIEMAMSNNTDRGRHPIPFEVQKKIGASVTAIDLHLEQKITNGIDFDYEQGNHPDGILMYKFREGNKTFVNTGDWEHGKLLANSHHSKYSAEDLDLFEFMLIEFLAGTDLVLTDSQYTVGEYTGGASGKGNKIGWGHPTAERALEVAYEAARLGGKQMRVILTHHDPAHTDRFLDKRTEELQEFVKRKGMNEYITFEMAREGMEVEI